MLRGKTSVAAERGDDVPVPVIGKHWPKSPYGKVIARYPAVVLATAMLLPVVLTIIALGLRTTVTVNTDNFEAEETDSYRNLQAVELGEAHWQELLSLGTGTVFSQLDRQRTRHNPVYHITLQFVLQCNRGYTVATAACDNLLDEHWLPAIKRIEDAATAPSTGFQNVCWLNNLLNGVVSAAAVDCAPVNSVTQYFYPSRTAFEPYLVFDGKGDTLMQYDLDMRDRLLLNPRIDWYTGPDFRNTGATRVLRSQIILGTPINRRFTKDDTDSIVDGYITNMYAAVKAAAEDIPEIRVTIGGDRVVESRVLQAMADEAFLAPLSCIVIVAAFYAHSRSVVVSALGAIQVLFTYLCSISLFGLARSSQLPLLSFVCLFFTIVWCIDGILVTYDNFIHSGIIATSGRKNTLTVAQRISYVLRKGLKGIVIAHLCVFVAFAVNTMSPVRELREFASLMLVVIAVSLYFFVFYTPAMVVFHHFYFSRRRRNLQRQKEIMLRTGMRERYPPMVHMLDELESLKTVTCQKPFERIDAERQERAAHIKEQRRDIVRRTDALAQQFTSEWNLRARQIENASMQRRLQQTQAPQTPAADDIEMSERPERVLPREKPDESAEGSHAASRERSPEGDGGEEPELQQSTVVRIQSKAFEAEPEGAVDLDEFADVEEAAAPTDRDARGAPPLAYRSMRHIPAAAVIHVPPQLMFRTPESVDFARRLVSAKFASRQEAPAAEGDSGAVRPVASVQLEGAESPAEGDDTPRRAMPRHDSLEEVMLDDEGHVKSVAEARASAPPLLQIPVVGGADDSSGDPLLRLERLVAPFNTAWSEVADDLMILPGDSPMAELKPIIAHRVIAALIGSNLIPDACATRFDSPAQIGAQVTRVGFVDLDGRRQTVNDGRYGDLEQGDEPRSFVVGCGPCRRQSTVKRRWCCGLAGQRVAESREERDARIMRKKVKHEGYSKLERFFYNRWASTVHFVRRPVLVLYLVALALAIWGVTQIESVDARVRLLAEDSNEEAFETNKALFALPLTPCDFCGGAYRNPSEFRRLSPTVIDQCIAQGFGDRIANAYLDDCGVCYGRNACQDCRGVPNGPNTLDACGRCLHPNSTERNSCLRCGENPMLKLPQCQHCAIAGGVEAGGQFCEVPCNETNCPPDRGFCSKFTGQCECHQSRSKGFFTSEPGDAIKCTRCMPGMQPPTGSAACTRECNPLTAGGVCGACTADGECTTCPAGYIGNSCQNIDPSVCVHGSLTNGVCHCDAGFTGTACRYDTVCNGRGVWRAAAVSPVGATCECEGAWAGRYCTYCRCQNGGTCNANGTCTCPPGWGGPLCDACAISCTQHGTCPEPVLASQYDPLTCMGVYCTDAELRDNVVCAPCVRTRVGFCLAHYPPYFNGATPDRIERCASDHKCFWNATSGACFERRDLSVPVTEANQVCRSCRGYWTGDDCNTCNSSTTNVSACNAAGGITACDGKSYFPGEVIPVVDQCGVCGGANQCVGCDGVVAVDGRPKRFDACGVCGGNGVCQDDKAPFDITFTSGIVPTRDVTTEVSYGFSHVLSNFDFMSATFQAQMISVCDQVRQQTTGINTRAELLSCPIDDFRRFVYDAQRNRLLNRTGGAVGFPVLEGNSTYRAQVFYRFLVLTNSLSEVGFTTTDQSSADFRVAFVKFRVRALAEHDGNADQLMHLSSRYDALAASISRVTGAYTLQTSERWVEAVTEIQSISGLGWVAGIAFGVFLMLMHVMTCSLTAAFIAGLCVALTCLVSLAFFAAFNFTLGAVEQVGVSLLIGMSVEHTIHMVETYLDTVQSSESHLFARESSRRSAIRTALAQSASPVLLSTAATVIVAAMYSTSDIQPFKRAAEIAIIVTMVSCFTSLVVVCAFLVMAGPVHSYRYITVAVTILMHWGGIWGIVVFALYMSKARAPDGEVAIG